MKILLLGSGGREHALAWKIAQSKKVDQLYIAPGNAGTGSVGENVPLKADDFEGIRQFVLSKGVDMVVVGPEDPLVKGVYDFFKNDNQLKDIPVIGPSKQGAVLEGSKDFAKAFMQRHGIPTAAYRTFTGETLEEGLKFLETLKAPYVLKADGLCSVKGVFITHYHFDHIYGLNSLTYLFPGLVVFATEIIATGLYSDKMNLSYYHNQSFVYQGKNLIFLSDNEVVDLDNGNKIVAIDTSGHNESCLSFMLNNYLFTGDSYIPNVKLVTNLPRSNKEKAKKSLERILGLIKDDTIVCPGHGAIIKNGY